MKKFLTISLLALLSFCNNNPAIRTSNVVCFAPALKKGDFRKSAVRKPPLPKKDGAPFLTLGNAIGTKNIAVVLMKFASFGSNTTQTNLASPDFLGNDITNTNTYFSSLKDYYTEVSYGQLTLNVTFFWNGGSGTTISANATAYSADYNPGDGAHTDMAYYGSSSDTNAYRLIRNAIQKAGISYGTTAGKYEAVIVVHAGYGNESTGGGKDGDIWSMLTGIVSGAETAVNGFTDGVLVPAREDQGAVPFGVLAHEFGHIINLPDLYDTGDGNSRHANEWDIMDRGNWAGSPQGLKPVHFSSWCKKLAGWITPTVLSSSSNITMKDFETNQTESSYRINVPGSTTEYFLLEYRKKTGFDESLVGEGVLIWHVDDSVGSIEANNVNVSETHPRLHLMEADNNGSMANGTTETADAFRTSTDIFTSPQSNSYAGNITGITISNFSGLSTSSMTTGAFLIAATTNLELKKAFNYPNPVKNSANTTIQLKYSRPLSNGTIKIYTVNGELVKTYSLSFSDLQASKSNDYEWVYEYVWDLANSSGNTVSSGIYLYVAEGEISNGKQLHIGKIAIIR